MNRIRRLSDKSLSLIAFSVPQKPMGVNHAYVPAKFGKRYGLRMTSEGHAYKAAISNAARKAMDGRGPLSGPIEISLELVYPDNRSDIDGSIKLDLDALQGIVYANDRQIIRLTVNKSVDRENPRIGYVVQIGVPAEISAAYLSSNTSHAISALRRKSDAFEERSGRLFQATHDYRDFGAGDRSRPEPKTAWGDAWDRPVKIPERV